MNYLLFICSDGEAAPEDVAVMQRECPAWVEEMDGRGVRLLGRALELPETAAAVQVRDGETLVTDGPFAETKEFVAGFDLLDCADLDEAAEVAAKHPSSWIHTVQIRPFAGGVRLGAGAAAFAREDDSAGTPYVLMTWMAGTSTALDEAAVMQEGEAWRHGLGTRGVHVLGGALQGVGTARTVRVRDGRTMLSEGSLIETKEFIGGIDVVSCAEHQHAIDLAAEHPAARHHTLEVRPFWRG